MSDESNLIEKAGQIIRFLQGVERLKFETRHAWSSTGRHESIAEHSWRLAMLVLALEPEFPTVNMDRVLRMAVIHDLGEAIDGDVSAKYESATPEEKLQREEAAMEKLLAPLEQPARGEIFDLWEEYNRAATAEARMTKAIDKLETILQHNQGENPADFDYRFNLDYGREATERAASLPGGALVRAIRELLDEETDRRANRAPGTA